MSHEGLTGLERWFVGEEAQQDVLARPFIEPTILVVVRVLPVLDAAACHGAGAVSIANHVDVAHLDGWRFDAQEEVPDRLAAILRDWERDTAIAAVDRQTTLGQLAARGVSEGVVVHRLGSGRSTMRRIDIEKKAVRVLRQQCLGTFVELVSMLSGVLGIDSEQRLLSREGVYRYVTETSSGNVSGKSAGPGRNGAVAITGLLCAHWRQVAFQRVGFFWGDRGSGMVCQKGSCEGRRQKQGMLFHTCSPRHG
ncbi:hypothetical protein D3C78_975470 [compost metagenome]